MAKFIAVLLEAATTIEISRASRLFGEKTVWPQGRYFVLGYWYHLFSAIGRDVGGRM